MREKRERREQKNNSTLYEIETTPPMKSNNSPYEPQRLKKISPPIKIGKTKQDLGKTVLGKN